MPLVKRDGPAAPGAGQAPEESVGSAIADLASSDTEVRWSAARRLGARREGVSPLAAALGTEKEPRVREAIMTALMRIGDEASVTALLPCLRSQDAGMRAAAIETLQALPEAILPFLEPLLADEDPDVRILATELARNLPAADATRILSRLLENERHPNVCGAAIEVLAEAGTSDALPALRSCAERFFSIPFLTFAASTAIARVANSQG
jgi:HEAT repeat protein